MTKQKLASYHSLERPEILKRIPGGARRVLDLGCGTGALGAALKKRQKCTVDGLELNPEAAHEARQIYNTLIEGNLDQIEPHRFSGNYDVIVFADILEHLANPWAVLRQYKSLLSDTGIIVASIPNLAHPAIVRALGRGLFRYQTAGILDITHLRFFTLTTICQLFVKAELKIFSIDPKPGPGNPYQYIVTARKVQSRFTDFAATIIMPVRNALEHTKIAVESIRENTDCQYKLVIVNDGSDLETSKWIEAQGDILHIQNIESLGFPTACNLGLECVDTPYCMLINSDVKVTPSWFCDLLSTMEVNKHIGILGPLSNSVSGPQQDSAAKYSTEAALHKYAESIKKTNKPRIIEFDRIVFFCALIRSEVIGKIGLLDESFGLGNFEDDDFCRRAKIAGYKNAIDRHVFIHHYGSTTFKTERLNYPEIMKKSEKRFREKWNL